MNIKEIKKEIYDIIDLIEQLPSGIDEDADIEDLFPCDVGGLIWRKCNELLLNLDK